ncbi:FIP1[V]-like protein [Sesamum alatum]|uniref:FIP1[V]-like protein n=1 Tax=Sesamum alatum TaxID=300844 RepID=A0AAE1Y2P1_9LAMI|nr:FIP1[V]-like protein [Sesamum alatum]
MEVEEKEEEELGELCSEILKNWTSDLVDTSLHENPFSHHYHHQQLPSVEYHKTESTINDKVAMAQRQPNKTLSSFTNEISTSEPKYDYSAEHFGLKKMKALTSYNEGGSKHEKGDDQNQPIIPLLVADTFFDKVLGHGVDGVDVVALSKAKEGKKSFDLSRTILNENDAVPTSVSTINNGKELRNSGWKPSLWFKCNFSMPNGMPKTSGETRCTPITTTPALSEIRSRSGCGFVGNLRFMLPPNKTIFDINIDNFGGKLWRNPGANMSDFFNYELDEKQWKDYCKLMASDILIKLLHQDIWKGQARVKVGRSGRSKVTADGSRQSHKASACTLNSLLPDLLEIPDSPNLTITCS